MNKQLSKGVDNVGENDRRAMVLTLLKALHARGSWCGETHIQKCAYFLQEGVGVPLDLDYVLYKHGPFSFALRYLLGEMRADLLVDVCPHPPFGPTLRVSPSGEAFLTRDLNAPTRFSTRIAYIAERMATRGVAELERLGTALYVFREAPNRPAEDQVQRITELKPHIPTNLARAAVDEIRSFLSEVGTGAMAETAIRA